MSTTPSKTKTTKMNKEPKLWVDWKTLDCFAVMCPKLYENTLEDCFQAWLELLPENIKGPLSCYRLNQSNLNDGNHEEDMLLVRKMLKNQLQYEAIVLDSIQRFAD